jgi:hypothetical protein
MTENTPDSLIPYDEIVRRLCAPWSGGFWARLRLPGICRASIISTSLSRPAAVGVDIRGTCTERFPDEMTIVIQNRFWDFEGARRRHSSVGPVVQPDAGQDDHPVRRDLLALSIGVNFRAAIPGPGR